LKIKDLLKFFAVLQSTAKTMLQDPTPTPRPPYPLDLIFSILFASLQKLQNKKQKINQIVDRVAFESFAVFFAVPLQFLCSFMQSFKKSVITKHHPYP
jgi:hypothetical protein